MRPYSDKINPKGLSGRRKSKASSHRKRSLRVDKKSARQAGKRHENDKND